MFNPIIHNLTESQAGYKECQNYNKLITLKPKGENMTLAHKLQLQSKWHDECQQALYAAKKALGCK